MKILVSVSAQDNFELAIKDKFKLILKLTDKQKLAAIFGEDESTFFNSQEVATVEDVQIKGNTIVVWPVMDFLEDSISHVKAAMQIAFDKWAQNFEQQQKLQSGGKLQKTLESIQKKYGTSPNSVVVDESGTECEVRIGYVMYDPKQGSTLLDSMIKDDASLKKLGVSTRTYNTKSGHKVMQVVFQHDLTESVASLNSRIKQADPILSKLGAVYVEAEHLYQMFAAKSKALKTPALSFTLDLRIKGWTLSAVYPFGNWLENAATVAFTQYMSDNVAKAKHVKQFDIYQRLGHSLDGYVLLHPAKIKFI